MSFARFMFAPAALGVIAFTTGCDNTLALPLATIPNIIDTVTLHALQGTAINEPSGFDMITRRLARTDRQGEQFDMAFDIDGNGRALIFTTASLGLAVESAIQPSDRNFADVTIAPLEDYEREDPLEVGVESVFLVRSRPDVQGCVFFLGRLPRYGKFRVLSLDAESRQITLENLVNLNCGYRSLEVGVPIR
jgi:hypothetical protein